MTYSLEENEGIGLVKITGAVTVDDAEEVKALVMRILSGKNRKVVVDCTGAASVDGTCRALLDEGCRAATAMGIESALIGPDAPKEDRLRLRLAAAGELEFEAACCVVEAPGSAGWEEDFRERSGGKGITWECTS